jgi:predicted lactoylglutathione lyase
VDQRISLITLGVDDLSRSRGFYEQLGWRSSSAADSDVVFFQANGMIFGLWGREQLDRDSGFERANGSSGVALAYNAASPTEVDRILAEASEAGATIVRPGAKTFWGGYSGLFHDPDGHAWEVAHNPGWKLAPDGCVSLTDASGGMPTQ